MTDFFKAIRDYICKYMPNQKCLSENTIKSHRLCLNLFVSYLRTEKNLKLDKITFASLDKQVIIDFLEWMKKTRNISNDSRRQRLSILRTFFAYAGELDCTNIALEQDIKKIPMGRKRSKIVEHLSDNALKTVLAQPDINKLSGQRDRFFMTLMYDTGARVSELLNLKICDLKIETTHPVVYLHGKGNKVRCVPLMPKTVEHCKGYISVFHKDATSTSPDYMFYTNLHGKRHQLTAAAVGKFMKKYGESARSICQEVPERVHPHQIRHTRAIHLYRDGMPLVLVGEQLGHADPVTTKVYAHADSEMKRKAIAKADLVHGEVYSESPVWENDDDMILKLVGLK